MSSVDLTFGELIRQERISQEVTAAEMALYVGCSTEDLEAREAGEVRFSADELRRVLQRLRKTPEWLFAGEIRRCSDEANAR